MGNTDSLPFLYDKSIKILMDEKIPEDSEYWKSILLSQIAYGTETSLRSIFPKIYSLEPSNIKTMLHLSVFYLNDYIHRTNLDRNSKNYFLPIQTSCFFIQNCLLQISQDNYQKILSQDYDDCGNLGVALSNTLSKALHIQHATISQKESSWCSVQKDDSKYDWLRQIIVESLILLRLCDIELQSFPVEEFATSTFHLMCFAFYPKTKNRTFNIHRRLRLIELSLLLLLSVNSTLANSSNDFESYKILFEPLLIDVNHSDVSDELNTYYLPLTLHFLILQNENNKLIETCGIKILETVLHIIDVMSTNNKSIISLLVLSQFVSNNFICMMLNLPCETFDSLWVIHKGTYADVLIDIVTRATLLSDNTMKVAIRIFVCILYQVSNISLFSAKCVFKCLEKADDKNVIDLVKAIHYAVNCSLIDNVNMKISVLLNAKVFVEILKKNQNLVECENLIEFSNKANKKLKEIAPSFKMEDLEKILKNKIFEDCLFPVGNAPSFKEDLDKTLEMSIPYLACCYFSEERKIDLKYENFLGNQ